MRFLLIVLSIVLISCSGGRNTTGYSLINDMMYSETYEAFSENPNFYDSQTMQAPPAGTIARGKMPAPLDADGNPVVMENPYAMTEYAWQRGEMNFKRVCSACHGPQGAGDGSVVTVGGFPAPPKFTSRRFKYSKKAKYPAGEIFNVITYGRGNMKSHAQQLYPEDRWYVAEYVRERLMTKGKR